MKRGTTGHPKFLDLCAALGRPKYVVVGVLETLWHFTAKYAGQGDIGRFPNASIARALEWEGDPDELISALVECHWLDHDPVHRLIVHDWHIHADQTVKRVLVTRKLEFVHPSLSSASICSTKNSQPEACSQKPEARSLKPEACEAPRQTAPPAPARVLEMPASEDNGFQEVWDRWPRQTNKESALRDWLSLVTPQNKTAVVACADRYLESDEVARGAIRNLGTSYSRGTVNPGWLADCARDNWQCNWPKARDSPGPRVSTRQQENADAWSRA